MRLHIFSLTVLMAVCLMIGESSAEHSAVVLILDGASSMYMYPENHAEYADGTPIGHTVLSSIDRAHARYELSAPVPQTEYGHAVIVTGFSNATGETVSYHHATIFDALRDEGYILIAIMEKGDSGCMIAEQDLAVVEKNNSVYSPNIRFIQNNDRAPEDLAMLMREYPGIPHTKAGKDKFGPYVKYNSWAIGFAGEIVRHMYTNHPDKKYLLTVNAGGLDSAGHSTGYEGYSAAISGLDTGLSSLIDTCNDTGTPLIVTGDHGMSFRYPGSKGSHASQDVSWRKESKQVPLLIYCDRHLDTAQKRVYGQECFAPTVLGLMEVPDTLSMRDSTPLSIIERPSIYVRTAVPANVTIRGEGHNESAVVNGMKRFGPLEKGNYTVIIGEDEKEVRLDHDALIEKTDEYDHGSQETSWAPYAAASIVSLCGLILVSKVMLRRR